jgi:hypothetical protein
MSGSVSLKNRQGWQASADDSMVFWRVPFTQPPDKTFFMPLRHISPYLFENQQ